MFQGKIMKDPELTINNTFKVLNNFNTAKWLVENKIEILQANNKLK